MLISIDTQAKAAYLKLKDDACHHTREILPEVFADFNGKNEIIGIELISPCVLTLRKAARKLHLPILNKLKKPLEEIICS
jgi:uncharacterized protein YuzE